MLKSLAPVKTGLTSLRIRNFQSLKSVDLDLEKFTVIVGPSSSGKTAITRAIKTLICNSRGGSFITHGASIAAVEARLPDGAVTFSREGSGASYSLVLAGQEPQTYTKLAGAVPASVAGLLGLDSDLCLAGQFDKPYLVDSSGSDIAKVLGNLTNVSLIFNAAQLANKKRLQANATLKIREVDLAAIVARLPEFQNLAEKKKVLVEAENLADAAQIIETKINRLQQLIDEIESLELKLAVDLSPVPDIEPVIFRFERFKSLLTSINNLSSVVRTQTAIVDECDGELVRLELELHELLVDAGTCPLCGSEINGNKTFR